MRVQMEDGFGRSGRRAEVDEGLPKALELPPRLLLLPKVDSSFSEEMRRGPPRVPGAAPAPVVLL